MSGSATLVRAIKTRLKAQGLAYRELGECIGISGPTVKRDLARGNFSLQRLDKICDVLGVSFTELIQPGEESSLTGLSVQQEEALASNAQALLTHGPQLQLRKDGPVQAYFLQRVIPEFFDSRFDAQGDEFRFVGGLLSASSVLRLQASIRRFAAEYEELARQDARLPFEQLNSCSAILALRTWEFSEISELRRDKTMRGSKSKKG